MSESRYKIITHTDVENIKIECGANDDVFRLALISKMESEGWVVIYQNRKKPFKGQQSGFKIVLVLIRKNNLLELT